MSLCVITSGQVIHQIKSQLPVTVLGQPRDRHCSCIANDMMSQAQYLVTGLPTECMDLLNSSTTAVTPTFIAHTECITPEAYTLCMSLITPRSGLLYLDEMFPCMD